MTELDDLDRALVRLLETDGRATYAYLATQLNVSTGTARNRLQRLVDQQVIQITAYPNPNREDVAIRAFVGFSVEATHLRAAAKALLEHPPLRYVAISTGSFEIVGLVEFGSKQEMLEFLTHTIGTIEGIKGMHTYVLLTVLKSLGRVIEPLAGS